MYHIATTLDPSSDLPHMRLGVRCRRRLPLGILLQHTHLLPLQRETLMNLGRLPEVLHSTFLLFVQRPLPHTRVQWTLVREFDTKLPEVGFDQALPLRRPREQRLGEIGRVSVRQRVVVSVPAPETYVKAANASPMVIYNHDL